MARFDRRGIDLDQETLEQWLHQAGVATNGNASSRLLDSPLANQDYVLSRWAVIPSGWHQWNADPDNLREVRRSTVCLAWWTDYTGRKHTRAVGYRGAFQTKQLHNVLCMEGEPISTVWMVYPENCFEILHEGQRELYAICSCGVVGPLRELAWMGSHCGPCYDREVAEEISPFAQTVHRRCLKQARSFYGGLLWSPEGSQLAVPSADHYCLLWDVEKDELLEQPQVQILWSFGAFTPDGGSILVGTDNGLSLMDLSTQKELQKYVTPQSSGIFSPPVFSPNGKLLASLDLNQHIIVWDVESGEILHILEPESTRYFYGHLFTPDSSRILAPTGQGIEIWNLSPVEIQGFLPGASGLSGAMALSPDGRMLAAEVRFVGWVAAQAAPDNVQISIWDWAEQKEIANFPISGGMQGRALGFSPEGQYLFYIREGSCIQMIDIESGELLPALHLTGAQVRSVSFSPNGQWLGIGTIDAFSSSVAKSQHDGTVRAWSWSTIHHALTNFPKRNSHA